MRALSDIICMTCVGVCLTLYSVVYTSLQSNMEDQGRQSYSTKITSTMTDCTYKVMYRYMYVHVHRWKYNVHSTLAKVYIAGRER